MDELDNFCKSETGGDCSWTRKVGKRDVKVKVLTVDVLASKSDLTICVAAEIVVDDVGVFEFGFVAGTFGGERVQEGGFEREVPVEDTLIDEGFIASLEFARCFTEVVLYVRKGS